MAVRSHYPGAVGWDQETSKQQRGWGGCSQTCPTETKTQRRKRRRSCGDQLQHGSAASQRQMPRAKQWVFDAYRWLVGFVMFSASAVGLEGSGKCEIPGSSDTGMLLSSRNLFEDSSPWNGRLFRAEMQLLPGAVEFNFCFFSSMLRSRLLKCAYRKQLIPGGMGLCAPLGDFA